MIILSFVQILFVAFAYSTGWCFYAGDYRLWAFLHRILFFPFWATAFVVGLINLGTRYISSNFNLNSVVVNTVGPTLPLARAGSRYPAPVVNPWSPEVHDIPVPSPNIGSVDELRTPTSLYQRSPHLS